MTLNQLYEMFRRETDDIELEYLWSESEVLEFLDTAQREVARRLRLLRESVTTGVTAGTPLVDLDVNWIDIRQARLMAAGVDLNIRNFNEMDSSGINDDYGQFRGSNDYTRTGVPNILLLDSDLFQGRLIPVPEVDDNLQLFVTRLPVMTLSSITSDLEIRDPDDQRAMVLYAKYLAFQGDDVDTRSEPLATRYLTRFEDFIKRRDGELRRLTRRPGTTRYGGL